MRQTNGITPHRARMLPTLLYDPTGYMRRTNCITLHRARMLPSLLYEHGVLIHLAQKYGILTPCTSRTKCGALIHPTMHV